MVDTSTYTVVKASDTKAGFGYLLFVPSAPAEAGPLPLLVSLHGAGESGSGEDPEGIFMPGATGCVPSLLAGYDPNGVGLKLSPTLRDSFVVVAPRTNRGWGGDAVVAFTSYLVDQLNAGATSGGAAKGPQIDRSRLYVTGVSMGGGGTFAAADRGLFAAAVPVCPAGVPRKPAVYLEKKIGVWIFHAENDVVVPVSVSDRAVEILKAGRAPDDDSLRYERITRAPPPEGYPGYDGHAMWMPAYQHPDLYTWLLRFKSP